MLFSLVCNNLFASPVWTSKRIPLQGLDQSFMALLQWRLRVMLHCLFECFVREHDSTLDAAF